MWQAHGQQALQDSSVLLINATCTGAEALKNLVLPGIGSYTVVDNCVVSEYDIGSNFFLNARDLGSNRAHALVSGLSQLNESVKGTFETASIKELVEQDSGFLRQFALVIISDATSSVVALVAPLLRAMGIPLISVVSCGFIAEMRIDAGVHTMIETHPDTLVDLRLDCPWPELVDFVKTFQFENMSTSVFAGIPYVVLIIAALLKADPEYVFLFDVASEIQARYKRI